MTMMVVFVDFWSLGAANGQKVEVVEVLNGI